MGQRREGQRAGEDDPSRRQGAALTGPRIVLIGSSGAGKTTLGRRLAAAFAVPFVELDALHFERDWVEVPDERMRDLAREATTGDAWVVDGNYAAVRDVVWPRATQIVWLDLPFHVVFARLLVRTLRRGLTGAELWHGNRERLAVSFFSSQSVVWWMLRTFRQRRAAFVRLSAGFPIVRLRTAREVEAWVVATTAR